jgi:hypothetical protein
MRLLIFLITLLFVSNSWAKCFIVDQGSGPAIIQARGFTPRGVIQQCPLDNTKKIITKIQDVKDVEKTDPETGDAYMEWVYDPAGRAQRLADEAIRKNADDQRKGRKATRIGRMEQALNNFDSLTPTQKDTLLKWLVQDALIRYNKVQE